ncbi:hypothetical protein [Acidovorax sp. M2(2025)]|uniref:hypothetical protein n=1 Tax=Acidovorax sp. M2(2025) TaxID=3411355 RepID=UPI003BF4AC93
MTGAVTPPRADSLPHPPLLLFVLGIAGSGAEVLGAALRARLAPPPLHILCGQSLADLAPEAEVAPRPTLTLLMGLEGSCTPAEQAAREAADARLRNDLAQAGLAYRVIYGAGEQRVAQALRTIKASMPGALSPADQALLDPALDPATERSTRLRAGGCEKCSDPACEHRLFSALLGRG